MTDQHLTVFIPTDSTCDNDTPHHRLINTPTPPDNAIPDGTQVRLCEHWYYVIDQDEA